MADIKEVALTGTVSDLKISYNFVEVNKNLDIVEGIVAQIDPSTADYAEILDMEKKLSKLSSSIQKAGTDAMRPVKAEIKEFEANIRAVKERIADIQKPLAAKHDEMDAIRRAEKEAKAKELIEFAIKNQELNDNYAKMLVVKPEYLNLSGTQKAVKEDILDEARKLKAVQIEEEKVVAIATAVIEDVNKDIEQKLSISDFADEIAAVRTSLLTGGAVALNITDEVKVRAKKIKDAEIEVAKKAVEAAKAEVEKAAIEAAKKAAEEARIEAAKQQENQKKQEENTTPTNNPSKRWALQLTLNGDLASLKSAGEDIKWICEKMGIEYQGKYIPA